MSTLRTLALAATLLASPAFAQIPGGAGAAAESSDGLITLDFKRADLPDVVEAIARALDMTILYDERVRGEITLHSAVPVRPETALAIFMSMLELKGFTLIETASGAKQVIPSRDAPFVGDVPIVASGDRLPTAATFVTSPIPLRFVKADRMIEQLRQMASKDARLVAYPQTNSIIVTDLAPNIRRMRAIIEQVDVSKFVEEKKVLPLEHANAEALTAQLSEIYGSSSREGGNSSGESATAEAFRQARAIANGTQPEPVASSGSAQGAASAPRFLADERTNSVIVLAPRFVIEDVERTVTLLDFDRPNRGGVNIYRLKNADAEDVAETLNALAGGGSSSRRSRSSTAAEASGNASPFGQASTRSSSGGGAMTADFGDGMRVVADAPTNSLIINSTPEKYAELLGVIEELDTRRPQVMIEGAILEVRVRDNQSQGVNFVYNTLFGGDTVGSFSSNQGGVPSLPTDSMGNPGTIGSMLESGLAGAPSGFTSSIARRFVSVIEPDGTERNIPVLQGLIVAAQSDGDTNLIATPKVLTADNEEAEIVVGETRGFPTSSIDAINQGASTTANEFQNRTEIERQDVGVTMRVTPQISEGDSVRMKIFTEITAVTEPNNPFGPTTSNRTVENTVYVKDGEAVLIGGIIQDQLDTTVNKVPLLGDIPVLGWAFRNEQENVVKTNLIMVLTPRIVRAPEDLERITLEGREKFRASGNVGYTEDEAQEREKALKAGLDAPSDPNPVRRELTGLSRRAPVEKLPELREGQKIREEERRQRLQDSSQALGGNYLVRVATLDRAEEAAMLLESLMRSGYDGIVLSRDENGRTIHYVQLGPYPSEEAALRIGREIKSETGFSTFVMIEP